MHSNICQDLLSLISFQTCMAQKGEHLKTVFNALFHAITINGNEALKLPKR